MRKTLYSAVLLLAALPAAANAAFVVNYNNVKPVPIAPPAAESNAFYQGLAANGIVSFSDKATVTLDPGVWVTFEFFGNEASYHNLFTVGSLSFQAGSGAANTVGILDEYVNNFTLGLDATSSPLNLGSFLFTTSASFNPQFYTGGSSTGVAPGDASGAFGIGIPNSVKVRDGVGSFSTDSIWFMFDDQTGNPDDNHDDLIIRATIAPVPEPSTWAMMIVGFGVIGLTTRRRMRQRVSFV